MWVVADGGEGDPKPWQTDLLVDGGCVLSLIIDASRAAKRSQREQLRAELNAAFKDHEVLIKVIKFYLRVEWPDSPGAAIAVSIEMDGLIADQAASQKRISDIRRKIRTMDGGW